MDLGQTKALLTERKGGINFHLRGMGSSSRVSIRKVQSRRKNILFRRRLDPYDDLPGRISGMARCRARRTSET